MSTPSVSLITWKISPISLPMDLVHFGFSVPFMRCRYSWTLPMPGKMKVFSCTYFMEIPPVLVFLMAQSSTVWIIVLSVCAGILNFLDGVIVVIWLAMIYLPLS